MFCSQTFDNAIAKDDHTLEHFAQETCADCNQNLIRIGGNLYILHTGATCIRECDYDNENYYDDVSSKLATVLVDEQHSDAENELTSQRDAGEWIKSEPNFDGNPLQTEARDDEVNGGNNSTAESTMDEDSQPHQEEANTSTAESMNDENVPQESQSYAMNIKMESPASPNQAKSEKRGDNKRECEFCGEFFHKYALYRHRRDVHNPTVCVCQICSTQFKSEEYLQRHMRYKHGATAKIFRCDTCQATFRKEDLFALHQCNVTIAPTENTKMIQCETCGKEFSRKQTLLKHTVLVHSKNSETIFCKGCARVFPNIEERDVHQLECTTKKYQQLSSNPCTCEICGKVLSRRGALQRHKALKH